MSLCSPSWSVLLRDDFGCWASVRDCREAIWEFSEERSCLITYVNSDISTGLSSNSDFRLATAPCQLPVYTVSVFLASTSESNKEETYTGPAAGASPSSTLSHARSLPPVWQTQSAPADHPLPARLQRSSWPSSWPGGSAVRWPWTRRVSSAPGSGSSGTPSSGPGWARALPSCRLPVYRLQDASLPSVSVPVSVSAMVCLSLCVSVLVVMCVMSRAAVLDAGRALTTWDGGPGGLRSWLGVSCRLFPVLAFACNLYLPSRRRSSFNVLSVNVFSSSSSSSASTSRRHLAHVIL